jgi:hypothetical protein
MAGQFDVAGMGSRIMVWGEESVLVVFKRFCVYPFVASQQVTCQIQSNGVDPRAELVIKIKGANMAMNPDEGLLDDVFRFVIILKHLADDIGEPWLKFIHYFHECPGVASLHAPYNDCHRIA